MTKNLTVAVIGGGLTGGYVARAAMDQGASVTVYSSSARPSLSVDDTYVPWLPTPLADEYVYVSRDEVLDVLGDEPASYSRRLWGERYPTEVDDLYNDVVLTGHPQTRRVWDVSYDLLEALFTGSIWTSKTMGPEDVIALQETYDLVAVCAPISFMGPQRPQVIRSYCYRFRYGSDIAQPSDAMDYLLLPEYALRLGNIAARQRTPYMTVYNAVSDGKWLVASVRPNWVAFELAPGTMSPSLWPSLRAREQLLDSTNLHTLRRLHPANVVRNKPPLGVLLFGTWAKWVPCPWPHLSYGRMVDAISNAQLVATLGL